jgi:hypothetical protein
MASSRRVLRQVTAVIGLLAAFGVMASIFVPQRLTARDEDGGDDLRALSTEAMPMYKSLGRIENEHYAVEIFSTSSGPLYSVYDREGRSLATLLTAQQVEAAFRELPLPDIRAAQIMDTTTTGPDW